MKTTNKGRLAVAELKQSATELQKQTKNPKIDPYIQYNSGMKLEF